MIEENYVCHICNHRYATMQDALKCVQGCKKVNTINLESWHFNGVGNANND